MSIDKRGNSWRARYRGPDGRERGKSFPRKIDAQRWLADQRAVMNRGEWVDPAAMRVEFGVLADEWQATTWHLKPKTRSSYRSLLRTRILPTWGKVPMARVRHESLARWIAEMSLQGLSPSRIRQAVYVVSLICQHAVLTKRLMRNPVKDLKLPKMTTKVERVFLDHAQVVALAREAGYYGTFIRTLAYTGLRWGEATALRVRDVDLHRRRIDVRRAFSTVEGVLVEGTPKSHQQRTVPLPQWLCNELAPLMEGRDADELVFVTLAGHAIRHANFRRRVWLPAVKAAGLDGLTPHGLRHTAASLYIAAGTPPKVVQRILGHASISITLDLYGHLYPDEMDTWADRLGEIAERAMRPDCVQDAPNDDPGDEGE